MATPAKMQVGESSSAIANGNLQPSNVITVMANKADWHVTADDAVVVECQDDSVEPLSQDCSAR